MIATAVISLATSFIGSFLCFVLWVHFDLEDRWELRKYHRQRASFDAVREVRPARPRAPRGSPRQAERIRRAEIVRREGLR